MKSARRGIVALLFGILCGACASLAPAASTPIYSTFSPGGDLSGTNVSQQVSAATFFRAGLGAPSNAAGANGQYYTDLVTGRLYKYVTNAWVAQSFYINITQDPTPSGASKMGIYSIGGSTRDYQNPVYETYAGKMSRVVVSMYSGWEASEGVTAASVYAAIAAINPNTVLSAYTDSTRTQLPGYRSQVVANSQYLANTYLPAGDPVLWGGDYVSNYASAVLDGSGRTVGQYDADYRWLTFHTGGAEGFTANVYNRSSYWDDVFNNAWMAGAFYSGGDITVWNSRLRAGWKNAWTRYRADANAAGFTGIVAANVSQMYCCVSTGSTADYTNTIDLGVVENIGSPGSAPYGTWFGAGNFVDLYNTRIVPLITTGGYAIFDSEFPTEASVGTTAFNQYVRYSAGACFTLTDALYGPLINKDSYYIPLIQYLVWRQFFDVDITTGIAKLYASAGNGFAWMGNPIDPPQIAAGTNGLVVRHYDHAYVVANPTDTGGAKTWTAPERVKLIQAADDPVFNGTVVPAGGTYSIPYQDALFFIPWNGAGILPLFVLFYLPRRRLAANDDDIDVRQVA